MAAINFCTDGRIYLELSKAELAEAAKANGTVCLSPDLAEELGNGAFVALEERGEFAGVH